MKPHQKAIVAEAIALGAECLGIGQRGKHPYLLLQVADVVFKHWVGCSDPSDRRATLNNISHLRRRILTIREEARS